MDKVTLFNDKNNCCGCSACLNVCPKNAISMQEDDYGFLYPLIDNSKCIECGACQKVCGYKSILEKHSVKSVYAAANRNGESLKKSASGGVFAVIAEHFVEEKGVVYGASMELINEKLTPMHIRVNLKEDIVKLQGSKYVQSDIGSAYSDAKRDLLAGKKVLFTGTPCQIAGFKQFLNKDYDNLLLADIICHGVPSKKFFQSFIDFYSDKLGGKIQEFYFRDKSKGQGYITRTVYKDKNGSRKEKVVHGQVLSYISFFSKSFIFRSSCYSCPLASPRRVGDLTMGDFWGFHEEYPTCKIDLSNGKGVSCILVNTKKGANIIENCSNSFITMSSEFDKVSRHNDQLNSPSGYNYRRKIILDLYKNNGYEAVEDYFHKNFKNDILKYIIYGAIPKKIKRLIKKIYGRVRNK